MQKSLKIDHEKLRGNFCLKGYKNQKQRKTIFNDNQQIQLHNMKFHSIPLCDI